MKSVKQEDIPCYLGDMKQIYRQKVSEGLSNAGRKGGWEMTTNEYEFSFSGSECVLKLDNIMLIQLCIY